MDSTELGIISKARIFDGTPGAFCVFRTVNPHNPPSLLHFHPTPEVYVVTCGVCRIMLDSTLHTLRRGSAVWLPPGQVHVILNMTNDCRILMVCIRTDFWDRLDFHRLPLDNACLFQFSEEETDYLDRLFGTLHERQTPWYTTGIGYAVTYLLNILVKVIC